MSERYRTLVPGSASGELLCLDQPLSLWGGFDPETGLIIDRSHLQSGQSMTGRIVVMPHGRGSSSSSSILAEALRLGTGPAGFVLSEPDSILVIGALVAKRLYSAICPIVCGPPPSSPAGVWRIDDNRVYPKPR
ncbi:MAG: aconitase X swivel domain-containing protein [Acidimicrobiia bacterium]